LILDDIVVDGKGNPKGKSTGINVKVKLQYKEFCLILLSSLALCLFSSCKSSEEPLHYGGQIYAEELLLQGLDVWSPYDLKIEHVLFTNPDDLVQAFRSGVVDVALFSDLQAARVFAEMGDQALIIAISERGDRMSTLVRADSGIQSWADLQGKKVALRSGSGVELAMKRYFALHPQLDWDAVEWINLAAEDMPAALTSGTVDAICALEPVPAMAQAAGGMRVLLSYGDCCPSPMVLVTTRDFAARNPEKLSAFLRGQRDKLALIRSDPAQAARIAAEAAKAYDLEIPASAFHIVFMRVDYTLEIDDAALADLRETASELLALGQIDRLPEFSFDATFLSAAGD